MPKAWDAWASYSLNLLVVDHSPAFAFASVPHPFSLNVQKFVCIISEDRLLV